MKDHEKQMFLTTIQNTAKIYNKNLDPEVVGQYWDVLRNYEFLDIKNSLLHHHSDEREGKFLPKPAHLIAILKSNGSKRDGIFKNRKSNFPDCTYQFQGQRCPMAGTNSDSITAGGEYWCTAHFRNRYDSQLCEAIFREAIVDPDSYQVKLLKKYHEDLERKANKWQEENSFKNNPTSIKSGSLKSMSQLLTEIK